MPPPDCYGSHPDEVREISEGYLQNDGTCFYGVSWYMRKNGFQPIESFIKEEDLLKQNSSLLAKFLADRKSKLI